MKRRICQGCGEPLEEPRKSQQYHNDTCKHAAYRAKKRPGKTLAHAPPEAPLVLLAGVDTFYVNVYYADPETYARATLPLREETQSALDVLQQQAQAAHKPIATPWSLLDQSLYSRAHGSQEIWGWILCNDYLNVQVGRGEYQGIIAHVRLSSEYLWKVGSLAAAIGLVNGLMNTVFQHEMYLSPGEIDLCADVAYWPIDDLDKNRFLSRAKKCKPTYKGESLRIGAEKEIWNGAKLGTLYFGERGSPVHGKVYDKIREIKDKQYAKKWFFDLWARRLPTFSAETVPVTRVEITVKREALHELGIDDCSDLYRNLKGLWAYVAGSETAKPWLRYTTPADDVNRARWPLDPVWRTVQHAFDDLPNEGASELIRVKKQDVNLDRTTAAIAGYVSTFAAYQCVKQSYSPNEMDLSVFMGELAQGIETVMERKETTFQEQIICKQERYYLRETKAREANLKQAKPLLMIDQEAL